MPAASVPSVDVAIFGELSEFEVGKRSWNMIGTVFDEGNLYHRTGDASI